MMHKNERLCTPYQKTSFCGVFVCHILLHFCICCRIPYQRSLCCVKRQFLVLSFSQWGVEVRLYTQSGRSHFSRLTILFLSEKGCNDELLKWHSTQNFQHGLVICLTILVWHGHPPLSGSD